MNNETFFMSVTSYY